MSVFDRRRLPPELFKLDVDRMRQGWYSDKYFINITRMLAALAAQGGGAPVAAAEAVGREIGEQAVAALPRHGGHGAALDVSNAVTYLRNAGCSPRVTVRDDHTVVVEIANCVFLEVAREQPDLICGFDGGLLCGLLATDPSSHRRVASVIDGDPVCVHEFAPRG